MPRFERGGRGFESYRVRQFFVNIDMRMSDLFEGQTPSFRLVIYADDRAFPVAASEEHEEDLFDVVSKRMKEFFGKTKVFKIRRLPTGKSKIILLSTDIDAEKLFEIFGQEVPIPTDNKELAAMLKTLRFDAKMSEKVGRKIHDDSGWRINFWVKIDSKPSAVRKFNPNS